MSNTANNLSMNSTIQLGSDPIKVNLLFDKIGKYQSFLQLLIDKSNNLEIEERSLKNLS
jgi:hypothetical protein